MINIALLTAGFTGSLVAFGGDTWIKGDAPILRRITTRGWLSIGFLSIALALGIVKEIVTKGEETAKKTESDTREKVLQGKLDDEVARLGILQDKQSITKRQLDDAYVALVQNKSVVDGIARVETRVSGQVVMANKELNKSTQVLDSLDSLQHQVKSFALVSALSKAQPRFNLEVRAPIDPIYLRKVEPPKTLVDLVFPTWKSDGIQDENQLLIAFELESASRPFGRGLNGSLWGFRKDPYKVETLGYADMESDPTKQGLETRLTMYGDAKIEVAGNQSFLVASYRFPQSQVPGRWLSEFHVGTRVFMTELVVRPDLTKEEEQRLIDFWDKMFLDTGVLRIPLLDQDNFYVEYKLKRQKPYFQNVGTLKILTISYEVSSLPDFYATDI